MNVALIGSVSSSHYALNALIRSGVEITAVCCLDESQESNVSDYRPLREIATGANLPFQSFVKITEPEVEALLRAHQPDLLWVIGLSQLVPEHLLEIARHGGIGFHPTMLPRGRGRAPVAWTILLGEPAAVNLFFMTDEPDAGDIIVQKEVPVLEDDYSEDLIQRTNETLFEVILELAPRIKAGTLPRNPQDHDATTYYAKRTPKDAAIDWTGTTDEIYRLIRATGRPYPGAFSYLGGCKIIIWRARPTPQPDLKHSSEDRPGAVVAKGSQSHYIVRTGDGYLCITEPEIDGQADLLKIGAVFSSQADETTQ